MASGIPVFLICGFLGAGKTTFIHQAVSAAERYPSPPSASCTSGFTPSLQCPLLIVNDFNDFNVDALTLSTNGASPGEGMRVRPISGGCICCTKLDEFVDTVALALKAVQEHCVAEPSASASSTVDFDHIIIESTGLADPTPILMALCFHPKLRSHCSNLPAAVIKDVLASSGGPAVVASSSRRFHIESAITFIDPTQFHAHPLMVDQLRHVNCIVVSKFDLLKSIQESSGSTPTAVLAAVVRAIREVNPTAEVYPAVNGALGPVLSRGAAEPDPVDTPASANHPPLRKLMNLFDRQGTLQLLQGLKDMGWADDGVSEADKYGYHTFLYHASRPFDEVKLVKALSDGSLLHGVTRSKGYFKLRGTTTDDVEGGRRGTWAGSGAPQDLLYQWNSCGRRFSYGQILPRMPEDDDHGPQRQSIEETVGGCKIVFIGRQMVQEDIVKLLDSCCAEGN